MANPIMDLSNEIYARGKQYRADNDFEGSITAHVVEDHIDAISKLHLAVPEFFTTLIERLEYILNTNTLEQGQRNAMQEMLQNIILPRQQEHTAGI